MHAEERQQALVRRLREGGTLRVSEFAAELGVSPITIRRDVEVLAERGMVTRVHGGAVLPVSRPGVPGTSNLPSAGAVPVPAQWTSSVVTPTIPGGRLALGMIVPAADYYYPEVIKGAREAAAARGFRLVLGISGYDPDEEQAQARQLLADGIDGLLITPCGPATDQSWLKELGVPLVLAERRAESELAAAEHVVTDHAHGARLAVRHLADVGRTRIGLVLRADSPHSHLVEEGYLAGLCSAGLEAPDDIRFSTPRPDAPKEHTEHLDEFVEAVADGRVDAALVHNDHDAILLLRRLRSRGLTIPGDVAIIAYDDEVAQVADVPLTAIAPPKHAVGAAAVDLLALRLADPSRPVHRLALLPELRLRDSSA